MNSSDKHDIAFYIPSDETIPTQLRLTMGGEHINYRRLSDAFGYDFEFYAEQTDAEAIDKATEIARTMCWQSYDHGQEWRVTSIEIVPQEERYRVGKIVRVLFRIKDSY